jgi:peptidoglycan hydrolase-like protein with peptidoglycan-binding domain
MSYTKTDQENHITELQTYLRGISFINPNIPRIVPDGIYGALTSGAVSAFQKEYGLPQTGETDRATWNKIYSVYQDVLEYYGEQERLAPFPSPGHVVMFGDKGYLIWILQIMINVIADNYTNIRNIDVNGKYDEPTMHAVIQLQNVLGIYPDGQLDKGAWNKLVRLYNIYAKTADMG